MRTIPIRRPGAPDHRLATVLVVAAALLLLARLGARDLWAPDEPRYGAIAEELRSFEHGPAGLVLLHLNGEPYTQKPPLWYWLAAAFGAPVGRVTETAARLPSALAGLGTLGLVLWLGTRLLGGPSALLGAALLATTLGFSENARRAQLDPLLTFFETAALVAFYRLDRGMGSRRRAILALHGAMGLAVLTKGPVGFLVPIAVIAGFLLLEGRLKEFPGLLRPTGLVLSLGPAAAWLAAAVALAPPGFFGEAVVENVFGRFFAGTSHARPFYYYFYQFPVELLPWSLLLPWAVPEAWRHLRSPELPEPERRAWRLLAAWVVATFVFFSLSGGKRGIYMMTALPGAALLIAGALEAKLAGHTHLPTGLRALGWCAAAGLGLLGAVGTAVPDRVRPLLGGVGDLLPAATAPLLLAVAVLASAATWLPGRMRSLPLARVAVSVVAAAWVELVYFAVVQPALDPEKSPRPIAEAAAALTPPGARVGLVGNPAFVGGLVYYGNRRVARLEDAEDILAFVRRGGRAIVVKRRKLDRVTSVIPVEVRFEARSGRRAIVVVVPAEPAPQPRALRAPRDRKAVAKSHRFWGTTSSRGG